MIKAFVNVCTTIAEQLVQFHEVRPTVETSKSEKSGISQLRHTREELPSPSATSHELFELFRRIKKRVRAIKASKVESDPAVGCGLTNQASCDVASTALRAHSSFWHKSEALGACCEKLAKSCDSFPGIRIAQVLADECAC